MCDQQLSVLSRVELGIFRVTHENLSPTIGVGTTIAIESGLSCASAQTGSIPRRHGVRLFTIAFKMVSSFRMQAVNSTFLAFQP